MVVKIVVVLLTLMFLSMECSGKIRIQSARGIDSMANHFGDFLSYVGKKYFNTKPFISVVIPRERDNTFIVMDKILKKLSHHWTFLTNDTYCCNNILVEYWFYPYDVSSVIRLHPDVYIVPVYNSFITQITRMVKEEYFNPKAVFILIQLTTQCGIPNSDVQNQMIFNTMWMKNVFTVNLFILSECDNKFTLVIAKPFSTDNVCRTVENNGLKYFQQGSNEEEYYSNFVHYEHESLNGCKFRVGAVPARPYVIAKPTGAKNELKFEYVGGTDIEFLRLLSQRLNFTYSFLKLVGPGIEAVYKRLPNRQVKGFLRDAMDYKVDIAFGKILPSYASYFQVRYSPCYTSSSLSWFVPDPNFVPRWKIIFKVFPIEIWVLLGLAFIMVCFLYWGLEHFSTIGFTPALNLNFNKIPLADLFSIGLGASSTLSPKPVYLRLLFAFWAIYSLHWYMAYTSVLFALMTNPPLEKEISNIHDLKDSGLKTSVDRVILQFFDHVEIDATTRSVLDNHVECPDMELCLKDFIKLRNFTVMGLQDDIESTLNLRLSKIHKLTDEMMTYHISLLMDKGSSLENALNKLLLLTLQLGFLNKWASDVQFLDYNKNFKMEFEEKKLPLNFGHLQGAFSILISGVIIAFMCFLGETFIHLMSFFKQPQVNKRTKRGKNK